MRSIAVMNPAWEPFTLINHENKAAFKRKINPGQATGGEIAFSVYLTRFGFRPELGQESRSGGAVLREICLESAPCVFLCLARFSQSPIYKHLRPRCCAFIFHLVAAQGHVPDWRLLPSTPLHSTPSRSPPHRLVWSEEMRTCRWPRSLQHTHSDTHRHIHTRILAHFYMHA